MPLLTTSLNELPPSRFEDSQQSIEIYANTLTADADVLQVIYNLLLLLSRSLIYWEYISGLMTANCLDLDWNNETGSSFFSQRWIN